MKVADFIIDYLGNLGIDNIFEVYGSANGDLIDAFTRTNKTRYISVMHEQAGGFAAEGYAKISGKIGVAIATSGPGGHNFVTPIGNFFYDSIPGLFITGQIKTEFLRPDESIRQIGFQETDIVGIVTPITKYAKMVTDPKSIKYELQKAIFLAQDKRPGPVLLDLPIDIQKAEINPDELVGFSEENYKMNYDTDLIDHKINQFLNDLSKSKRPVLMVGGGVRTSGAAEEFLELVKKLKIPVIPTWNAIDVIPSNSEYCAGRIGTYGGRGRNFAIQNSDLLLSIGSRISGRITGGYPMSFARAAKKYMVDIDPSNLDKKFQQVTFDENIVVDAKLFIERFLIRLKDFNVPDFTEWRTKTIEWREKYDTVKPEYYNQEGVANPYVFMRILSEEMKEGDVLVGDCGGNIVILSHSFETKPRQRVITNNGNSPMGFSFSGAMGAYLAAKPGQNIVCTIGDGGFNMNLQELQTIKNYNMKVKTFIINNHCYGITRQFQKTNFQGRQEACGPKGYSPPDFIKIANAYGIKNFTISNNSEIREVIKKVLEYGGPVVCDVNVHDWETYTPRVIGWKTPIEDMDPYLDREEFRKNMFIEPLKGWENHNYQ